MPRCSTKGAGGRLRARTRGKRDYGDRQTKLLVSSSSSVPHLKGCARCLLEAPLLHHRRETPCRHRRPAERRVVRLGGRSLRGRAGRLDDRRVACLAAPAALALALALVLLPENVLVAQQLPLRSCQQVFLVRREARRSREAHEARAGVRHVALRGARLVLRGGAQPPLQLQLLPQRVDDGAQLRLSLVLARQLRGRLAGLRAQPHDARALLLVLRPQQLDGARRVLQGAVQLLVCQAQLLDGLDGAALHVRRVRGRRCTALAARRARRRRRRRRRRRGSGLTLACDEAGVAVVVGCRRRRFRYQRCVVRRRRSHAPPAHVADGVDGLCGGARGRARGADAEGARRGRADAGHQVLLLLPAAVLRLRRRGDGGVRVRQRRRCGLARGRRSGGGSGGVVVGGGGDGGGCRRGGGGRAWRRRRRLSSWLAVDRNALQGTRGGGLRPFAAGTGNKHRRRFWHGGAAACVFEHFV
eukprot:Rhum_TRINITY_DN13050_c1_g1::Rhum_TRINITY_DN13050_c1_g1_i1::g.56584::m.56584